MAGKRNATSELNHDNWEQEDEPEDAGTFQRASEDALKRRIIKTARRRNPISSVRSEDPDKKSAFTGFTAFTKTSVPVADAFSFLTNIKNQSDKPKTNGTDVITENSDSRNDNSTISIPSLSKPSSILENTVPSKDSNGKSNDYFSKLKGLNESVSNWIKKHVDTNPLINLQPIFKDYEKYFKELEKEEDSKSVTESKNADRSKKEENSTPSSMFVFKAAENVPDSTTGKKQDKSDSAKNVPKFSFGSGATSVGNSTSFGLSNTTASNTFSFGSSNMSTSTMSTPTPSFSFGSNASTSTTKGFSFSGSTPFTFTNVAQPSSSEDSKKQEETEEDDAPPKVEFTPVVEKDHIFTTRCKVFVKKSDGKYGDRGVGNLYLKPIENSEKVQLIVRADTNLGNLLCNFILSECIPTKRMGKKDVMLVCLPTPDVKPPPVPILLRVKSPEEADNLLEVLDKHKK